MMKKCCKENLEKVKGWIGNEVKSSIASGRSHLGPDPSIIIKVLFKIQDKIKAQLEK